MKFIAKNLNLIGLLLLAIFAIAAAGLYFGVPQKAQAAATPSSASSVTGKPDDKEGCCSSKPAAPAAATGCPHLDTTTDAAPATPAGCCPHQ